MSALPANDLQIIAKEQGQEWGWQAMNHPAAV